MFASTTATRTLSNSIMVLIVDDHPLVREGLRVQVEHQPGMEVCGEADGVVEALRLVKQTKPDLIIVDISLRNGHGFDLIQQVHAMHPKTRMLVISAYDEYLYAERSLRAGAHGYVNKGEVQECIVEAMRTVCRGETYLSDRMTQHLIQKAVSEAGAAIAEPTQRLSNREMQVFQLIGEGKTTSAIANALGLSVHTIDTHREKIRHKLGLRNGGELMQLAVQWVLENR